MDRWLIGAGVVVVAVVAGMVVLGLPDIARYLRIRRM